MFGCATFRRRTADIDRHEAECTVDPVEPTERFVELVSAPDHEVPLAEAAFLIAAHDHEVDIAGELEALEDLARRAPETSELVARYLFVELGFAGNEADYADPRNSYLDEVLRRRLGIPITLSVLMLEVGRRQGLVLAGVGMPGHFLVRGADGAFYDPFHGGVRLDEAGCRMIFEATRGPVPFRPEYLRAVGSRAILARMLANLVQSAGSHEPAAALWATRLRLLIPGLSVAERHDGALLLGRFGQFSEAATALDALAADLPGEGATRAARDAAGFRARAN